MTGRVELLGLPPGMLRLAASGRNSPEIALEAARQFEALLVEQLLRTMREAVQQEKQDEESAMSGGETYLEIAEQHLAQAIAARGGFGIARLIARGLGPAGATTSDGARR